MSQNKPKPPVAPARPPGPPRSTTPPAQPNPGPARWQRTVRYGWDKGGAGGGKR